MTQSRFKVVFQKLAEARREASADGPPGEPKLRVWLEQQELDEIDELRRLSLELAQPEQKSYTTT